MDVRAGQSVLDVAGRQKPAITPEIAAVTQTPAGYSAKVLQTLARAGLRPAAAPAEAAAVAPTFGRGVWQGFLTNALNPKVALFFLAFVPQFIAPNASHPALTFVWLGVLFNVNALPINVGYALLAAWATRRLGALQRAMHWLDRVAGAMFIGFGLKLAFTDQPAA